MVEILATEELNVCIMQLIERARRHIVIVSPFLKINQRMRMTIQMAIKRGVKLTVVYGKKDLDKDTVDWLKSLPYCNIGYLENLHAKLILNEETVIMSSMNLYEYSQVNNVELGMIADLRGNGKNEYKDLLYHTVDIINLSEKQFGSWDIDDIEDSVQSLFGIIRRTSYFIPVDHVTGRVSSDPMVKDLHCIRCNGIIPPDCPYVYCQKCFDSWKRYMNLGYVESKGHCFICGKDFRSSADKPACVKCYGENTALVKERCDVMKNLVSSNH